MTWLTKLYLVVSAILLIVLAYVLPSIHVELVWFFRFTLGAIVLTILGILAMGTLMCKEWYLERQAKRHEQEHQARVIDTQHGTWFIAHKDIDVVPLHSTPYLRINGHERDLTPDERFYTALHAPRLNALETTTVPLQGESSGLDLLTIFTQPTQSYAIIAGQQVGKTFQARRIAQYWLDMGCKSVVIGPKWDKGEWEGCTLFGGEYNLQQVNRGMQIIKKLAEDRHSNKNLSHKQHAIQPVFFDDWTAIAAELPEAEEFILKATTLFASVNIILYFMIHLDTANAWGVQKIGAALKNNFVKLLIYPGYNESGLIDRGKNRGYIIRPGETIKDKRQVSLFSGTGSQLLLPDLIIPPQKNSDTLFVELVTSGKSRNEASLEAYGRRYAGDLVERGKRALGEI